MTDVRNISFFKNNITKIRSDIEPSQFPLFCKVCLPQNDVILALTIVSKEGDFTPVYLTKEQVIEMKEIFNRVIKELAGE